VGARHRAATEPNRALNVACWTRSSGCSHGVDAWLKQYVASLAAKSTVAYGDG
jgi:hypothetical protein